MVFLFFFLSACEEFLDVPAPNGQITQSQIFEDPHTAEAAVTTLYTKLRDNTLLTGRIEGMNVLMGLYADELDYYGSSGQPIETFYRHQIIASNSLVLNIWKRSYELIYMCNSVMEGLQNSEHLSTELKDQLMGEALFVRALTHFYLTNLFGKIPYITQTDYEMNQDVSRQDANEVYLQIKEDLLLSKSLLPSNDLNGERTRATSFVASALLARVYLYNQEWQSAVNESSLLLNESSFFILESNIENEFLKESTSAILQLKPGNAGQNTHEAISFIFQQGPPSSFALNEAFINSFEEGDLRKQSWINSVTDGNQIWYMPYKYKQSGNTGTTVEYSIVFRLAEQYLIRAEAHAHLGNLSSALFDLNKIRSRAGLAEITSGTAEEVLESIYRERKSELFTEQGHRWFDLKRLNKAAFVLSPIKPSWRPTDILLPVPESEILLNPNLLPQNEGY